MSRKHSVNLLIGFALILLCAMFPSWRVVGWGLNGENSVHYDVSVGRAFVITGPSDSQNEKNGVSDAGRKSFQIDGGQLLAEIAIVASAVGVVLAGMSFGQRRP